MRSCSREIPKSYCHNGPWHATAPLCHGVFSNTRVVKFLHASSAHALQGSQNLIQRLLKNGNLCARVQFQKSMGNALTHPLSVWQMFESGFNGHKSAAHGPIVKIHGMIQNALKPC